MARCRVLAGTKLCKSSEMCPRFLTTGQTGETIRIQVTKAKRRQAWQPAIGNFQRMTQCIAAFISESRRIRSSAHAYTVQHQQKYSPILHE